MIVRQAHARVETLFRSAHEKISGKQIEHRVRVCGSKNSKAYGGVSIGIMSTPS
jgi:hypothetical protein